ncbi:proline-rich protein 29 [Tiliqua scincoides]|uniref:proline-rich protein 29 n=1 Tax=Tiliqua scincoides TaxID=71010 RepID=UPI0034620149
MESFRNRESRNLAEKFDLGHIDEFSCSHPHLQPVCSGTCGGGGSLSAEELLRQPFAPSPMGCSHSPYARAGERWLRHGRGEPLPRDGLAPHRATAEGSKSRLRLQNGRLPTPLRKPAPALAMDSRPARNPSGSQGTASPQVRFIQQPIAQQPEVTVLQQMPWTLSANPPSSRTCQIREDLMDLMMIQNAQMHQVIMNNLAVSALAHFGHSPLQISHTPWQIEEEVEEDEPEPLVFHHHYASYPSNIPYMAWPSRSPSLALPRQQPTIRHVDPVPRATARQDGPVVPPPPPPSATGTVTADVPPASEYYDFAEGRR